MCIWHMVYAYNIVIVFWLPTEKRKDLSHTSEISLWRIHFEKERYKCHFPITNIVFLEKFLSLDLPGNTEATVTFIRLSRITSHSSSMVRSNTVTPVTVTHSCFVSSTGLLSTGKTWTCWSGFRGGLQKLSAGWNTSPVRKGWELRLFSLKERRHQGDLTTAFQYLEGAYKERWKQTF